MRPVMYFLDEQGEPVGVSTLDFMSDQRAREWYEHAWELGPRSKRLAETTVDDWWVSTVFLMIDHQFDDGPPVLWETMIFPKRPDKPVGETLVRAYETAAARMDPGEQYCARYTSREAALQGHARVVAALLAGKTPEQLDHECDHR